MTDSQESMVGEPSEAAMELMEMIVARQSVIRLYDDEVLALTQYERGVLGRAAEKAGYHPRIRQSAAARNSLFSQGKSP